MKKNNAVKLICFGLCVLMVLAFFSSFMHYDKSFLRYHRYTYTDVVEKDTVDAVYIGTSGVHCFWITGQAFHDYGMTVYPLSCSGLESWHYLPMLKFALKTQKPELVVLDMRSFTIEENSSKHEIYSRYFNEMFPIFSSTRFEGAYRSNRYLSRLTEDTKKFDLSFYLNVFRYHDMWEDGLDFKIMKAKKHASYGFFVGKKALSDSVKLKNSVKTDESMELAWFSKECLDELIDYLDKENIEVLFVNSPRYQNEGVSKRMNGLINYLEERSLNYIDFCSEETLEEYPFDAEADFRDQSHTNYSGASKFTSYLSEYLNEHYDLKDRRNDPGCADWEKSYEKTLKTIEDYGIEVKK